MQRNRRKKFHAWAPLRISSKNIKVQRPWPLVHFQVVLVTVRLANLVLGTIWSAKVSTLWYFVKKNHPIASMPFWGTIREKTKLSAVYFAEMHVILWIILRQGRLFCGKITESFDFPGIILPKSTPFRRIIRRKSKLSTDHTAERHAFLQDNSQNAIPLCKLYGFYSRKACLDMEWHAFPWILPWADMPFRSILGNLQKVLTFCELYPGKACLSKV